MNVEETLEYHKKALAPGFGIRGWAYHISRFDSHLNCADFGSKVDNMAEECFGFLD